METAIGYLIALAVGAHTTFTKMHDAAHPFDAKEWQIEVVEIPGEENSLHDFIALQDIEHNWDSLREASTLLTDATGITGYPLDKQLIKKLNAIRKEHAPSFAGLDRIVDGKQLCTPPFSISDSIQTPTSSILKYGNFLHLTMLDSVQRDRSDSFSRDWKRNQKLATELLTNNPILINLLVAMSLQAKAIPAVSLHADDLARRRDLASLRDLQDFLHATEPTHEMLRNALKGEYRFLNTLITEARLKDFAGLLETNGATQNSPRVFYPASLEKTPQFLPNRFRREICDHFESLFANETFSPSGEDHGLQKLMEMKQPGALMRSAMEGNAIGTILFGIGMPAIGGVRKNLEMLRAKYRIMELKVALLRYEVENSQLPKRLPDLSPRYIKPIPADPFSGKPLRFNRKERSVYSVGLDGKDNGGDFLEFLSKKDSDFGLKIPEISP